MSSVRLTIAGLYMIWTRGTVGDLVTQLAISGDGMLILICAAFALRFAMACNFTRHRRWALRLFMVASAVWFFRVGLMGWTTLSVFMGIGIFAATMGMWLPRI